MTAGTTLIEIERRVKSAKMIDHALGSTAHLSNILQSRIDAAMRMAKEDDDLYASIGLDTVRKYLECCEKNVQTAIMKAGFHDPRPSEEAVDCAGKFRELAYRIAPMRSKIMEQNTLLRQEIADEIEKLSEEAQEIHRALPSVKTGLLNRVCS